MPGTADGPGSGNFGSFLRRKRSKAAADTTTNAATTQETVTVLDLA